MRQYTVALVGVARAIAAAAFTLLAASAVAAPPGAARDADVGKKLFSFNVIVFPGLDFSGNDTVCENSGHRIFFNEDGGGALGTIGWTFDPAAPQDFKITDCDGTLDNDANVVVDETLKVWVMVRLVGPKNSALDLTCTEVTEVGADDLCVIGTETITKGNSFTKIMKNLVDNQLEEVTWTLNNSLNAKVLQVWIFELL